MRDSTGPGAECSRFCLPIQRLAARLRWIFCGKNLNYLGITKTQDIVFLNFDFFLLKPRYFLKLFLGKLLNHLINNAIVR